MKLLVQHVLDVLNELSHKSWVWRHQMMGEWCLFDVPNDVGAPERFCVNDYERCMSMHSVVAWLCSEATDTDLDIAAIICSIGLKDLKRPVEFHCQPRKYSTREIDVDKVLACINRLPEESSLQWGYLLRCDPKNLPAWIEPRTAKADWDDEDGLPRFGALEIFNSALAKAGDKRRIEAVRTGQYKDGDEVIEGYRYVQGS